MNARALFTQALSFFFTFFVLSWHNRRVFRHTAPYLLPGPPRVAEAVSTMQTVNDAAFITAMGALRRWLAPALSLALP